jgi:hypothetical protein
MTSRKRQLKSDRKMSATSRTRTPARRRAVKTAELAKIREEGDAKNAARALGRRAPARKRKIEPVVHKPVAKANTSIPADHPSSSTPQPR